MFIAFVAQFVPIIGMNILIKHFEGVSVLSIEEQIAVACGMTLSTFLWTFMYGVYFRIAAEVTIQLRSVANIAIFHKSLKLSAMGRELSSTGQIQNLVAKDSETFLGFIYTFGENIYSPFTIIIGVTYIYLLIGWSVFVGCLLFVIVLPVSAFLFGKSNSLMLNLQHHVDARLKSSNEVFSGMKIIKLYCWEKPFQEVITSIRNRELKVLQAFAYLIAWGICIGMIAVPVLQPLVVFFTYVKTGHELTASKAFTTIALFNLIKLPFGILPMWIGDFSMMRSALLRMHQFMARDEMKKNLATTCLQDESMIPMSDNLAILVNSGSFTWKHSASEYVKYFDQFLKQSGEDESGDVIDMNSSSGSSNNNGNGLVEGKNEVEIVFPNEMISNSNSSITSKGKSLDLSDINLNVKKGELLIIIGSVGSGKSSLLQALLGEMKQIDGSLNIHGSVAYLPQKPWILNDTIQNNIALGNLDREKLKMAVDACALRVDIEQLRGGLLCEIGSRGVNLSGGQRTRINLARCSYSDNDIYLLDDPLSSVDAHVGNHIFNKCICGVLSDKTRVVVTNALQYLSEADHVVVMHGGKIVACGTYDEILQTADKNKLVKHLLDKIAQRSAHENEADKRTTDSKKQRKSIELDRSESLNGNEEAGKIIEEEKRLSGSVSWQLYKFYMRNCGWNMIAGILILFCLSRLIENGSVFWLSEWAQDTESAGTEGLKSSKTDFWLLGYSIIVGFAVIFYLSAYVLIAKARVIASRRIHTTMLECVLRAPMHFFDITPIGRITNRFSRDMDVVDSSLPNVLNEFLFSAVQSLGQLLAVVVASKGLMAFPLIPLTYGFYLIQKYFRASNTEVTRLQSISRSPFFNTFNECLEGITSIRAHKLQDFFTSRIQLFLNSTIRCQLIGLFLDVWMMTYLSLLAALLLLSMVVLAICLSDILSAGLIGISLVYITDCIAFLSHATMLSAKSESQMNAIERLVDFCDLNSEAPAQIKDRKPPDSWPKYGKIEINNLTMGYADGPEILHGINANINAGEKIGICGRTGSGKTSLMTALFRLEEPRSGSVLIDGVDILEIGLDDLRSRVAIIPQEAIMFSGTVRLNVDPFTQFSDDEIWSAIDKVRLGEVVRSLPFGLDDPVTEGGNNFSIVQSLQLPTVWRL
eukprot:TRINITY_DN1290_c0_g1_i7.p1 TRINITY_DN1290_c0_g1~~TRINITY_DN1290_c0_g1_i7.p1  ORF type:complete len:1228 (-),score=221.18 TRINITY_DN1290_c0_g1_i7:236-3691(-)